MIKNLQSVLILVIMEDALREVFLQSFIIQAFTSTSLHFLTKSQEKKEHFTGAKIVVFGENRKDFYNFFESKEYFMENSQ